MRLIRTTLQEVLEAEMTEALGAAKSERTAGRNGYRSGYYGRTLDHAGGQAGAAGAAGSHGAVFDRAVRALSALGAGVGGGAGGDVRARCLDAQGQGDHRRVMRAQLFGVVHQHDQQTTGRRAWPNSPARPLDEAFPYLIVDARYERVREAGVIVSQAVLIAIGIDWEGRRQMLAVELANRESRSSWSDFLLRTQGARASRRGVRGLRRSCGAEGGDSRSPAGSGLAALLRPFPAQRPGLRAAQGRRRLPAGAALALRPPRSGRSPARSGGLAGQVGGQIPEAHRLGGREHRGDADLLPAAAAASQAPEDHQHAGAVKRGDQTPHPCGADLPQRARAACAWSAPWPSRPTRTGSSSIVI